MQTAIQSEERYDQLMEVYTKNLECIYALVAANEALQKEMIAISKPATEETSYFAPGTIEQCVIQCYKCGSEHDVEIEIEKEDDFLNAYRCCECGAEEDFIIYDIKGRKYDYWTGKFELEV